MRHDAVDAGMRARRGGFCAIEAIWENGARRAPLSVDYGVDLFEQIFDRDVTGPCFGPQPGLLA
jgi:hypothetical protein